MKHQKQPPPTAEQLKQAFHLFQTHRPREWLGSLEQAMADPMRKRLIHARAAMLVNAADKRSRSQLAVRCQRADGTWTTRMHNGPRTAQLALPEVTSQAATQTIAAPAHHE